MKKQFLILALSSLMLMGTGLQSLAAEDVQATTKQSEQAEAPQPIIAVVKASWCGACEKIAPTIKHVMQDSMKQAQWVVFDISDRKSAKAAQAKAKELGLETFFKRYGTQTATVAFIHPESKKVLKVLRAESKKEKYLKALAQVQQSI